MLSQNLKSIPFKQIKGIKYMGLNQDLPFNVLLNQKRLLYLCGRQILLQNLQTYEQKVIYTNEQKHSISIIDHFITQHQQSILGIIVRDNNEVYKLSVININSIINNCQHLNKKDKERTFFLKGFQHQHHITNVRFLHQAALVAVVGFHTITRKNKLIVYNCSKDDQLYSNQFPRSLKPQDFLIEGFELARQYYVCIIHNQQQNYSKSAKRITSQSKQISTRQCPSQMVEVKAQILNTANLNVKTDFYIQVMANEVVKKVIFTEGFKCTLAIFMLDSGFITIALLKQYGFLDFVRIDVRINKKEYAQKNKVKTSRDIHFFQDSNSQCSQNNSAKTFQPIQQYYYPNSISCSNQKIAISYNKCNYFGLINYSAVNHRQFSFTCISDIFNQSQKIDYIKGVTFSLDGIHCSLLTSLKNQSPAQYSIYNPSVEKTFNSYNIKKIEQKDKKRNSFNQCQGVTFQSQKQIFQEQNTQILELYVMDLIGGIVQHEYRHESVKKSLTSCSLKGNVQHCQFNKINNTMFIITSDGRLMFYYLNPVSIGKGKQPGIKTLRENLRSTGNLPQNKEFKKVQNYLQPEQIILWQIQMKNKPNFMVTHSIIFQVVFIFDDNIKFHFYNHQKLGQCHHIISLKNCMAASYSPLGDKLVLGNNGGIMLVDSYTHAIIKKVPLVIFPSQISQSGHEQQSLKKEGLFRRSKFSSSILSSLSGKTVTKIQFLSNSDIMLQTGNATLSMLYNYQKVSYFGITQSIKPALACYDQKHDIGVIVSDKVMKVIRKASINSKHRCQQIAKIQMHVTAIKLCTEIDVLFFGTANGILYFIRWPDFFMTQANKNFTLQNRLYLFNCPIVNIQVSINYQKLFVVSKQGTIIICQMINSDQVEKIGRDVSFVMSKRIQLTLPMADIWFNSIMNQDKKAQQITKIMGNQAQTQNSQFIHINRFRQQLEKQHQFYKNLLDNQLKEQIKNYQIQSGIAQLIINISKSKDQYRVFKGKRQRQTNVINERLSLDLHKIFTEREQLQKQLAQVQQQNKNKKQIFLQHQIAKNQQFQFFTNQQLKQKQLMKTITQKMFIEKQKIDKEMQFCIKQDFEEQIQSLKKHYQSLLEQEYHKNNQLLTHNRNYNIALNETREKMRQWSVRIYEFQSDISNLQKDSIKTLKSKQILYKNIAQNDRKYHQLVKKTKDYQTSLKNIRSQSQSFQLAYDGLYKQMQDLTDKLKELEQKQLQSQDQFNFQYNVKNHNQEDIKIVKQKLNILKIKRKQKFDHNVLLKNLMVLHQHNPDQDKLNLLQSSSLIDKQQKISMSQLIQLKKQNVFTVIYDLEKMSHLKNDNKNRLIRFNKKIQVENDGLIFKYNLLKKQTVQNQNILKNLKEKIHQQKIKQKQNNPVNEGFSLFLTQEEIRSQKQNKKNMQNNSSLHSMRSKFTPTICHFHKQDKKQQKKQSSKVLNPLVQKYKSSKNKQKLKMVTTNFQSINEKFASNSKFQKLNNNSIKPNLYHGVLLDKKTLKPKKTLCFSLHMTSEDDKFVTQF